MRLSENKVRQIIREEIKNVLSEAGEYQEYEPTDVDHHGFVSKQMGNVLSATEEAIAELRNRKRQNDSPYIDKGLETLRDIARKLRDRF